MQTLLVGVQLCDYQEPQAFTGFCKCLLYFQRKYPEVNVSVMNAYRMKAFMAGQLFLSRAKTRNYDYLLIVDGDIVMKPSTLIRLYERQLPIISAMFVDPRGQYKPYFYRRVGPGAHAYGGKPIIEDLACYECPGSGCILMSKELLDKLSSKAFYQYGLHKAGDTSFFERVYETGTKVYIDTKVRVGHIKMNKKVYWPRPILDF